MSKKLFVLFILVIFAYCLLFSQNVNQERKLKPAIVKEKGENKKQKIALVIGISSYKESPLRNPVNDANDMADVLKKCGFEVILKTDVNQYDMEKSVQEFGDCLNNGGTGLFYFSGHGIQVGGNNYLIPAHSNIKDEIDIMAKSVRANSILGKMARERKGMNIMILDACRNNPFIRSFRSPLKGLAQMIAPEGSLIVYATSPGKTAADGAGRNGLYTKHLLKMIKETDFEIMTLLRKVRQNVEKESNGQQTPWDLSSLSGSFFFSYTDTQLEKIQADISQIRSQIDEMVSQKQVLIKKKAKKEIWETEREEKEKKLLLKAKQLEKERLLKEKERKKILEKEEKRLQQELLERRERRAKQKSVREVELKELQIKLKKEQDKLEDIKKEVMSIEEARDEVKLLEAEIRKATSLISPIKEKALAQIKEHYEVLLKKLDETHTPPKDQFETLKDYEARINKHREKIRNIKERYNKEFSETKNRYDKELESNTKYYNDKIKELVNRKYSVELLIINLIKYDAERKLYRVQISKPFESNWFYTLSINPEKARELFNKRTLLRVKGFYKNLFETNSLGEVYILEPNGECLQLNSSGISLRSEYIELSEKEVVSLIKEKGFFDLYINSNHEFKNDFEIISINNDLVIFDYASNLIWNSTVIPFSSKFGHIRISTLLRWIKKQNNKSYAIINNWRLPTLEEAASLLKMSKNNVNRLHITPIFKYTRFIVTGDKDKVSRAFWIVNLESGRIKIWEGSDGDSPGVLLVHPMQ